MAAMGKGLIARLSRQRLQALAWVTGDFNPFGLERHGISLAKLGAEIFPAVRVGAQAMVNVYGGELESQGLTQSEKQVEEDDGIKAAAQGQRHVLLRKRKTLEKRG